MHDARRPLDLQPRPRSARPRSAPEPFEVDVLYGGRTAAWVSPHGELDVVTAPQLQVALREALSRALLIIVDLRELTFSDCAGLHLLVDADARARLSRRRLLIVRGPAQIDRLFALVGLSEQLHVIDLKPLSGPAPTAPADCEPIPQTDALGSDPTSSDAGGKR